ncbi:hypothetical protein FGLOB1_7952 [Fusarium globosum]|uniref:Uncharacterized protein n=1 Tax=Fusarium globosum TaxID=78864 RepID=A0A8H5Y518_9HYPO|nr:hypothetical protein FGLOB1_7952 [Fusarium globosum]
MAPQSSTECRIGAIPMGRNLAGGWVFLLHYGPWLSKRSAEASVDPDASCYWIGYFHPIRLHVYQPSQPPNMM